MKTADPELMRAINRFHVLDTIRRFGPIARVEIGERTVLSPTTVSAITAALIEDGLISVQTEGDIRNVGTRGRPRVMLKLNPEAARVVGAKIASNRLVFVVTNFQGDVLADLTLPVRVDRLPIGVIADLLEDGVRRCVLDAGLALSDMKTVALSLPGIVEHGSGRIRASAILQDSDALLIHVLKDRLAVDTIIESDANAITMAEHWFGRARDLDDFVLVAMEESLGLGVLHEGQLFRGAQQLSLMLGDMTMGAGPESAVKLADVAGERAILDGEHEDRRLRDAARLGQGMDRVRRLIEDGDNVLRDAAARAGAALGIAIANLVTLFAPPRVVLVGSALALGDYILEPLREAFSRALPQSLSNVAEIVVDNVADELWARGAAAVALGELYGSPWGTTGPARRLDASDLFSNKAE
jgi:predicted NBD/HSP70 family sugar kinase